MKVREEIDDNGTPRTRWVEIPTSDPFDTLRHEDAIAVWEQRLGVPAGTLED